MKILKIVVPGVPMAKPRMTRRDKWRLRPCVARYREFADRVRKAVGPRIIEPTKVLRLDWLATFTPPKRWSKKDREAAIGTIHRQRPDRDNLDKAVLDCLFSRGDEAIGYGTICKRWAWVAELVITISLEE